MKILSRYIARVYLKFWLLSLLALTLLVLLARLFGNIDNVFSSQAEALRFLDDTVRSLPAMLDIAIPMTVLLATLFTFNSFGRSSELVAMRSVGVGLYRQLRPICFVLLFVAALDYANQNYFERWLQPTRTGSRLLMNNQWSILRDEIVYVRAVRPGRGQIRDTLTFRWTPEPFRIDRIEHARRVTRDEGDPNAPWRLAEVTTHRRTAGDWNWQTRPTLERPRDEFPDLFQLDAPNAHHLPLFELSSLIRQLQSLGRRVEVYQLEWYQKTAALFAPFALVLFGAPLAQTTFRSGRGSGEIMVGILGGLLFLIATELAFTLGRGGFLPPLAATWGVNVLYVLMGGVLILRSR